MTSSHSHTNGHRAPPPPTTPTTSDTDIPQEFHGKVAVVTGSSSGIGECVAVLLAARGAKVTLCGRDEARLANARERCVSASGGHVDRFTTVAGDLTLDSTRRKVVDITLKEFGQMDVLIANAGIIGPFHQMGSTSEATFDLVMDTNLKAVYFLIQTALPHLAETRGNIVCVSSVYSTWASPTSEVYQISKAGIDCLVRSLALTQAHKGIRVNSINPTYTKTRILERDPVMAAMIPAAEAEYSRLHPLEGRASRDEEQAKVVVFLASDAASFVTGQNLKVDGGISLGHLYQT